MDSAAAAGGRGHRRPGLDPAAKDAEGVRHVADWFYNGFARDLADAIRQYEDIAGDPPSPAVELWEMEQDRYGNRFVVITRRKTRGRPASIRFIRKIKP